MKHILALMVCLAHLGCGKSQTDATFLPYMEAFNQAARADGMQVNANATTVRFFTVDELANSPHPFGDCLMGKNIVRINPQSWAWMSGMNPAAQGEALKEELLMHELGHCVLLREHNPVQVTVDSHTIYGSVMNPSVGIWNADWTQYHARYMHELFYEGSF